MTRAFVFLCKPLIIGTSPGARKGVLSRPQRTADLYPARLSEIRDSCHNFTQVKLAFQGEIRMTRAIATAVLTASLITGCATGYHSATNPLLGWTGGYWDRAGPGELIKVGFAGNGYSKEAKVQDYLMLRCAEIAQSRNKPHFAVYGSIGEAIIDQRRTERLVTPVTNGPSGFAYILLEDEARPGTLATAEILAKYAHIRPSASATSTSSTGTEAKNDGKNKAGSQ